ncbi:hypothetical protein [Mycoplasma todarodis]|uniref:hypothetical protein n=1 Tax=Mycoplasma todarodis TaxID=1937191 RepID=UPI003B3240C7
MKIKKEITDQEIFSVEKNEIIDNSLQFITKWYTSGIKEFGELTILEKKELRSEVENFDESEVAEFSASSFIEMKHHTTLVGSNVELSGNKKMKTHGVDLVHKKGTKIVFIEVKGAKDNAKQTKATLIKNFENAQGQLNSINDPKEISRFSKVLRASLRSVDDPLVEKLLENLYDFERGEAKLARSKIELLATVVYPENEFDQKFSDDTSTKQFLIEIKQRGKNLGREALEKIEGEITSNLEEYEKH